MSRNLIKNPKRQKELSLKVAITGHTKGIGKAVFDSLTAKGHTVKGFSKSTGYPLPESIDKLVSEILDYDVFINNTYWGFAQALILDHLLVHWADVPNKRIICMGSTSADLVVTPYPLYTAAKKALETLCHLSQSKRVWPLITNLKLGMVDTHRMEGNKEMKLSTKDVSSIVHWLLALPPHLAVPEIVLKNREQLPVIG